MAGILNATPAEALENLRRRLKQAEGVLGDLGDDAMEEANDIVHPLEDEYEHLVAAQGGAAVMNENEDLRRKRIQTREVLRRLREMMVARWDFHYSAENLAVENADVNVSNAETDEDMSGGRRRRKRKSRRRSRKTKRAQKSKRRAQSRKGHAQ